MRRTRFRAPGLLVLLLVPVLAAGLAYAKPGKPAPPAPDPVDTGEIYLKAVAANGPIYVMHTDGTDPVATGLTGGRVPSTVLHGGERWFLELQEVEGDAYPSGYARHELFAVTAGGTSVQLTDDPAIEPIPLYQWIYGNQNTAGMQWATADEVVDGKVSLLAVRRVDDVVVEHGIYVVALDPADLCTNSPHVAASYGSGAAFLAVDIPRKEIPDSSVSIIWATYDWSPDGESVVYAWVYLGVPSGLMVAHAADAWVGAPLTDSGSSAGYLPSPRWSPDGTLIAFESRRTVTDYPNKVFDLRTIEPDGENEAILLRAGDRDWLMRPRWSPSGDYLVYDRQAWPRKAPKGGGGVAEAIDVYRVAADGSGAVDLTASVSDKRLVVDWLATE